MSKQSSRVQWVTLSQVIATIMVVLGHSFVSRGNIPSYTQLIISSLQHAALSYFMCVSGFLIVKTKQLEKYGIKEFYRKRFMRLLIPYFAVSALMIIPRYLLNSFSTEPVNISIPYIIKAFCIPRHGILPHLWFLPTCFFLSLLAPVLIKICRNLIYTVVLLLVALVLYLFMPNFIYFGIDDVCRYLIYFALGIVFAEKDADVHLLKWGKYIMPGAVVLYSILTVYYFDDQLAWMIKCISSIIIISFASMLFEKSRKMTVLAINSIIGKYTLTIYILSLPFQNIVEILVNKMNIQWFMGTGICFVTGIVFPIVVGMIAELLGKKLKIVKVILGI